MLVNLHFTFTTFIETVEEPKELPAMDDAKKAVKQSENSLYRGSSTKKCLSGIILSSVLGAWILIFVLFDICTHKIDLK